MGIGPTRFRVSGDDSAACFPIAGALVSGGRVTLRGLAPDSEQPDAAFRAWAAAAGGKLEWERAPDGEEALTVTGPDGGARSLLPVDADLDAAPDAALPLAALVAFACGTSRLSGVARLREKESDRLAAALDLLTRAGAVAREERDGHGPGPRRGGAEGIPAGGGVRGARRSPRRHVGGRPRARAARGLDAGRSGRRREVVAGILGGVGGTFRVAARRRQTSALKLTAAMPRAASAAAIAPDSSASDSSRHAYPH